MLPLALETYTNIGDEQQRADFLDLAQQEQLRFLFYDRALRHRLAKLVRNDQADAIAQIAAEAQQRVAAIPPGQFDFDAAKADIIARTSL